MADVFEFSWVVSNIRYTPEAAGELPEIERMAKHNDMLQVKSREGWEHVQTTPRERSLPEGLAIFSLITLLRRPTE